MDRCDTLRLFNSGCNYGNPTRGLSSFNSNNNNTRSNTNGTIGFRSDLPTRQMWKAQGLFSGTWVSKGIHPLGQIRSEMVWKKNTKAAELPTLFMQRLRCG